MKFIHKNTAILLIIMVFCIAANAQSDWVGSYDFAEDGGKTAGGTAVFISHQMDISEADDGYVVMIKSAGYQTSKDLICTAKVQGNNLLIYFDSYGEDNVFESYKQGDLLFTLENKMTKGKSEILTYWGKFTPSIDQKAKSGKVYFKKMESTNINE